MSKSGSKNMVRLNNKSCSNRHKIPKDLIPIMARIKSLDFVVCVGTSPYITSNKKRGIRVIGFDDIKKTYRVNVSVRDYEQKLHVKIKGEKKDHYKEKIVRAYQN